MKHHQQYLEDKLAAGVILLLAAILMMACSPTTAEPVVIATTAVPTQPPTATPTDIPSPTSTTSPTPSATPTDTPLPVDPTLTPTPSTTPTVAAAVPTSEANSALEVAEEGVKVYETTITLLTYPIRDYLTERIDPVYNIPVYYFDRQAFEAADPAPTPIDYTGVVLENDYLRLTFLPELGGRLYSALIKSTGQEIFYQNDVVKPSRYGVLQPAEANWWLATGGMEWAYPTQEHGYRWGVPWTYHVTRSADEATITLSDVAPDRIGAEVQVTLPADRAVFTITPTLTNAGPEAVPVQFWLNAALTLAPDTMSPQTQFIVPTDKMIVHSRGEAGWTIPDSGQESPWPMVGATDLSDYSQWTDYLGFFIPNMDAPFIGAYNPEADLGVVRLIEPGTVPGNKLFAFSPAFLDRSYTDDNSQYFEIWGGANAGFWPEDDIFLPGGGTLQWQEHWWSPAGLGGLSWANQHAAIHLNQIDGSYELSVLASQPRQVTLTVSAGKTPVLTETFTADPTAPRQWSFTTSRTPIRVELIDLDDGVTLLAYSD